MKFILEETLAVICVTMFVAAIVVWSNIIEKRILSERAEAQFARSLQ